MLPAQAQNVLNEIAGNLSEPHRSYICFGGQATYNGRVLSGGIGCDLVWDLWNEQFSAFYFPVGSMSLSKTIGVGVTAYVAIGFGRFDNVHAAWSGQFNSVSASVAVPGLNWKLLGISVGGSGFASPDFSMTGGAATVTAAISIPIAVSGAMPANLSIGTGMWYPFNQLTEILGFGYPMRDVGGNKIVGLEAGVTGVATHMFRVMPSFGQLYAGLATFATAVSVYKSAKARGWL